MPFFIFFRILFVPMILYYNYFYRDLFNVFGCLLEPATVSSFIIQTAVLFFLNKSYFVSFVTLYSFPLSQRTYCSFMVSLFFHW